MSNLTLQAQINYLTEEVSTQQEGNVTHYFATHNKTPLAGYVAILNSNRKTIKAIFIDGVMHGRFEELVYGKISVRGEYDRGIRVGKWITYFSNGIPRQIRHYNKKGELEGQVIDHYIDGVVYKVTNYRTNKKEGVERIFDRDGKEISYLHWSNDQKHGDFMDIEQEDDTTWHQIKGTYVHHQLHGLWRLERFDAHNNKILTTERQYENGNLVSEKHINP